MILAERRDLSLSRTWTGREGKAIGRKSSAVHRSRDDSRKQVVGERTERRVSRRKMRGELERGRW